MTVTQTPQEHSTSDEIRCTHCGSPLPAYAIFCGACGERVRQDEPIAHTHTQQSSESDAERYRITALVGRRPHVQLFLATDTLFNRPVTIRDITVSSLDTALQAQAVTASKNEYDLLRRQRIPGLTPVIDFRASNGHILVVGGWPFPLAESGETTAAHTLQDLLQSGIGLPNELAALTWVHRLCTIVSPLHRASIILGILDPDCVLVSTPSYASQPALMVSWLPQAVRTLLSQGSILKEDSHFSAPEVHQGQFTPRSDLYSLGTLLYLLLTGLAPEEQTSWIRTHLQKLRERTPRLSKGTEELVLRALSPDPSERFQNADEMSEALQQQITSTASKKRGRAAKGYSSARGGSGVAGTAQSNSEQNGTEGTEESETIEATVSVVPIRAQLARWHLSLQETRDMTSDIQSISAQSQAQSQAQSAAPIETQATPDRNTGEHERIEVAKKDDVDAGEDVKNAKRKSKGKQGHIEDAPTALIPFVEQEESAAAEPSSESRDEATPRKDDASSNAAGRSPSLRARITGILPAFPKKVQPRVPATQADLDASSKPGFLAWLNRLSIGEQREHTTAAALIETPLRVQPNQGYTIRVHLMGRDAPSVAKGAKKGAQAVGLSSLKKGEIVHIEVRSAIYQNYAYIVQRADVYMPGDGFAAEVTIPMQPLSAGQNGRRERLHIFFMDELRQPLYEKPFVLEVFVSHLVQAGREGHNVLSIPI